MKKKGYIFLGLTILVIFAVFIIHENSKPNISDIKWNLEEKNLKVTFLVLNDTNKEIKNKLNIRAFKDKRISNAIVADVLGEKTIEIYLSSKEEKMLCEYLDLNLNIMPDIVLVTVINN